MEGLFNESLHCILEAGVELNKIQEPDEFTLVFEADNQDPETKEKNETAAKKSQGWLKKAVDSLLSAIKKIIDSIHSFFSYSFASKENKAAFKKFKEECMADPELRNKKVTYLDYSRVIAQYDKLIKDCEELEKQVATKRQAEVEAKLNRIREIGEGIGGATAMSVGLQGIEKMMERDQLTAEAVNLMLIADRATLNSISKTFGEKRYNKLQKDAQIAAGYRISIKRLKIMWLRRKQNCVEDAFAALSKDLRHQFGSPFGRMMSAIRHNGTIHDVAHSKEGKAVVMGSDPVAKSIRDRSLQAYNTARDAKAHGVMHAIGSNIDDAVGYSDFKRNRAIKQRAKSIKSAKNFYLGKDS